METTFWRSRSWLAFTGLGLVALLVYRIGSLAGFPELATNLVYWSVDAATVGALLLGVRLHRPASRAPWLLFAAGQASALGADVLYYGADLLGVELPAPNVADLLYLLQYVAGGLALVLLVRRRTPGRDLPTLIDAGIVAVSTALLSWVYLIAPSVGSQESTLAALTAAAYPVGDLVLLSLGARLMLGAGSRPPAFRLLGGFLALVLVPDSLYTLQALHGPYAPSGWLECLWMTSWILLGGAGLHRSMRELSDRSPVSAPDATLGRMLLLVSAQRRVAITDGLTGLATRRHFEHSLAAAVQRADGRHGLAVLLLDVDLFKAVNDTYGHHGGDRVLCEIADRLRAAVRPGDLVARYGGEEFALLLPHITPREARQVADRVHRAIRQTPIAVGTTSGGSTEIRVTASIGIATLPVDAPTAAELVLLADQLLYRAKENGRDRVAAGASLALRPAS